MTDGEIAGIAAAGAVVGLCPITEANLGDGLFPAAPFLAAGGRFGVGSDSNVRIDASEELRLLEYSQRLGLKARAVMADSRSTGRVLWEGAAQGGARAAGRGTGAIAVGEWADLLAPDTTDLRLEGLQGDRLLDAFLFAGLKWHRAQTVVPHPIDLNETAWLRTIGGEELQKAANVVSVDVRADCKS